MDPIEEKRRELEEAAAKRRRSAQAEEEAKLEHSAISHVNADPPAEDIETARLRLELERTRLELERDKLLFERQKLEAERRSTSSSGTRRPSERTKRPSERTRAGRPPSGTHPAAGGTNGSPRRTSAAPMIASIVVVGTLTMVGGLYFLNEAGKLGGTPAVAAGETPEMAALRAKAEAGDGEACLSLGLFLWNGVGTERDPAQARVWIQRAAERGDARVSAEAVVALDRIRGLERDQREQAIQLAELQEQRERDQEREQARRLEEDERRRRALDEQAAAHVRERTESQARRLAELKAQARALKDQLSRPVLPTVLRAGIVRLDALVADRLTDDEVRRIAQEARDQVEIFRHLSIALGVSEARRLADDGRYKDALEMLRQVHSIGGELTESTKEEARRWVVLDEQAGAAASAAASASDETEAPTDGPDAPAGAFRSRSRERIVAAVGPHPTTEEAVQKALRWLERHQSPDGRWDTDGWTGTCKAGQRCAGPGANAGDARYDVGTTSLALLAYLGNGHTHRFGAFKQTVTKGLQWLTRQQASDGSVGFDASHGEAIYNHAIATLALCEAYGVSQDATLKPFAERAATFCVESQNAGHGWKYGIQSGRNDTSVTGWMVLALKAATTAGIEVPDAAFAGARTWFSRTTDTEGNVGYETPGGGSSFLAPNDGKYDLVPCMTAVAITCRIASGERRTEPAIVKGTKILGDNLPSWSAAGNTRKCNMYYWYYGTNAMFQVGGSVWMLWDRAIQAALLPRQRTSGCAEGSWDPVCEWALAGGRVYSTAISALTLEVYYRYERVGAAPAARAPAASGTPADGALAKVEADVRRRFASWIRIRGASAMSCARCRGTERARCTDCGGDGINEVQRVDGLRREPCPTCTNGSVPCKDAQCLDGLDKQALRTAFWDSRSQDGKRGKSWENVREQLMRGELDDLVGSTLIVQSAEVTSVDVLDDRAQVTAIITWGDEGRAQTWSSTWVRYQGRYYLATDADVAPEPLR